jgi:hypothetical protein
VALAQRHAEHGQSVFVASVRDEVEKLTTSDPELKELRALFPKDPAKETDPEKRAAIEAGNKRFDNELSPSLGISDRFLLWAACCCSPCVAVYQA